MCIYKHIVCAWYHIAILLAGRVYLVISKKILILVPLYNHSPHTGHHSVPTQTPSHCVHIAASAALRAQYSVIRRCRSISL
jgi:hypothetical protein